MRRLSPSPDPTELSTDDLADAYATSADRPVRASFVSSADGSASLDGRSGGLGTTADRQVLAMLRDLCDVIFVGAGTARAEGYGPPPSTAERRARRAALGLSPVPRLAVVSARLELDPAAPLFQSDPRTIVVTHAAAPADRRQALEAVADVVVAGAERVDTRQALDLLSDRGLTRVLCEGGPTLAGTLLSAGRLDELCLTLSPLLAGGTGGRILHLAEAAPNGLELVHVLEEEGALFLRYAVTR
jgi:riboflavin biosynthesis pyrimidine reductase